MRTRKDLKTKVSIQGKEYNLKITAGWYRKMQSNISELKEVLFDPEKSFQGLKWALFYGNCIEKGWKDLDDMNKDISDLHIELLESPEMLLNDSFINTFDDEKLEQTFKREEQLEKVQEDGMNQAVETMLGKTKKEDEGEELPN